MNTEPTQSVNYLASRHGEIFSQANSIIMLLQVTKAERMFE
jgi:hypothetical protein